MGNKKKTVILLEEGARVLSDLQGYLRISFDDAENLPAGIERWDFTKFYNEDIQ